MNANYPSAIEQPCAAAGSPPEAHSAVGDGLQCDLNERHEAWLREQYLRDLDTLDRIEQQLADAGDAAARGWCDK